MITGTYIPSANGVAVSVSELKRSLEKRGHEVFLFAPDNKSDKKVKEKNVFRYPSIENPIHKDYPIPLIPINSFLIKTLPKKRPDLIHVHHAYHIGYFAKLMADHYKVPLVFTYHTNHDLYAKKYTRFLPKSLRDIFINNLGYDFCKQADLVISPAEHTTKKLLKKVKKVKVITIPSGITLDPQTLSKGKLRKENGYAEKKVLLTVGRLSAEKNIDFLIKVMKFLPTQYLLLVAGDGPDEKKLKKLTHKLGVQRKVRFLGKIERRDISNLYGLADLFVFGSDSETQGLVFLEAMKFGLATVAVDSEAAEEWLGNGAGEISAKTPSTFAKKVLEIEKIDKIEHSKIIKKLVSRYSPENTVIKIENAYKRVLASKRRRLK